MATFEQSDTDKKDFCELLFTKALAPYFRAVSKTNPNGFNSSAPAPGLWELFVYDTDSFRSAAKRSIRAKFVTAVQALGQYLHTLDAHDSDSTNLNSQILAYISSDKFTPAEQQCFDMFFNIVVDNIQGLDGKAVAITVGEYKRQSLNESMRFRVNVKTIITGLDTTGAYSKNVSELSKQQGGNPTTKLALITSYLPLVQPGDGLPENAVVVTQVGGADAVETRAATLRILMEIEYEQPGVSLSEVVSAVVSAEEIAQYLACNHQQATAPLSNTLTLAALPTNSWRKLSDGSYEKLTTQGYKPLSKEECAVLLNGTCAGSTLKSGVCDKFMEAVNSQDEQAILTMLGSQDVWDNNAAADSLDKLHPETVLRILKALKFGTKSGPFGKRVCTVDEWVSECIKGTTYAPATLSANMRAYLEYLVNFVNSNPSLVDPSKRHNAAISSKETCETLAKRGLYYAGNDMHTQPKQLSFADVSKAVQTYPFSFNHNTVALPPAMAYGSAVSQHGGNQVLYTQAVQAPFTLGSGIGHLVEQALNGLRSTNHGLSAEDEAKIKQKVANLTALEQEIYQTIMQLNEQRIAADSGINCHSQLSSTQDRLMQLSSVYDRKAPCLQELCEQLRMLLAQQQNKNGCAPLE